MIKDPNGAYSQLLQLQEVNTKREGSHGDDSSRLQSASDIANSGSQHSSIKPSFGRSMSRYSPQGGSRRDSQAFSLHEQETEGIDDAKPGENVIRRLLYLHKPEVPILLLGCTAAAANGAILPVFGMLLSSAINTFYEPPEKLRKDSIFRAEMYVMLGVISMLVIPMQYTLFNMAGGKLIERIRSVSFSRVVYQEIGWFDDPLNSRYFFVHLTI